MRSLNAKARGMTMAARAARRRAAKPGSRGGLMASCSGLLVAAGILFLCDGLGQSRSHRAQVDAKWNAGRLEADGQVRVVAEGLVRGFTAAAERRARKSLDGAILAPNVDLAAHEQRAIPEGRDGGRSFGILLGTAVQPPVKEGAARASLHDVGNLVSARRVGQDPWPPVELEDLTLPAQALGDVDADVQVEADLDVFPVIDLPHWLNIVA
jgi:hypothetical protein